jgi:hypothetical protein
VARRHTTNTTPVGPRTATDAELGVKAVAGAHVGRIARSGRSIRRFRRCRAGSASARACANQVHITLAIGVKSRMYWPCGQDFGPSPDATDGALCVTRREARVTGFDCGPGAVLPPALPHRPADACVPHQALGVLALLLTRGPTRGREGLQAMTQTEHNSAAHRRGELTRDRGSRRGSAIDAQRRLDTRRARRAGW